MVVDRGVGAAADGQMSAVRACVRELLHHGGFGNCRRSFASLQKKNTTATSIIHFKCCPTRSEEYRYFQLQAYDLLARVPFPNTLSKRLPMSS
jgi:hypothetical protein